MSGPRIATGLLLGLGALGLLAPLAACEGATDAQGDHAGACANGCADAADTAGPSSGMSSGAGPHGDASADADAPSDASADAAAPGDDGAASDGPPGQVPVLVGVGYGGLRLISRDAGRSWSSTAVAAPSGGDDHNLLRAVAWASDLWLAVGWQATTSRDGVNWSPMRAINTDGGARWDGAPSCALVEGLTSDGEHFYAVCTPWGGDAQVHRSRDAEHWERIAEVAGVGAHTALDFRDGTFFLYGDDGASFRSVDGRSWSRDAALQQATYCEGSWRSRSACDSAFWLDGAYFRSDWPNLLKRRDGVAEYVTVHTEASGNTLYAPRALARGYGAP